MDLHLNQMEFLLKGKMPDGVEHRQSPMLILKAPGQ